MRSNFGRFVVKKAEGNKWLRQIGKSKAEKLTPCPWLIFSLDALSLLDKVLLHEMTHGRMAFLTYLGQQNIEGTDDMRTLPSRTNSSTVS
jgi:hypothetical protein